MQMIKLLVQELQWIKGSKDDPEDHCAHGRVFFTVNETEFVKPDDGVWTVSASALYLLRTLTENHTAENSVADGYLFPCCGFVVLPIGGRFKVLCLGCMNGIELEIIHQVDTVTINSSAGSEVVPKTEWTRAVLDFTDSVRQFYRSSLPKVAIEDEIDKLGWATFWQEWDERYRLAKSTPS
jgi:hypothetical protein